MRSFLIRPIPLLDENLKSYLIRLAVANKSNSIFQLYKITGLINEGHTSNLTMITDHSISLQKLSMLSTFRVDELIRLTFYEVFGRYIYERPSEVHTIFGLD